MRMYDLIEKKRNGACLTKEEIHFMISGFTNGSIPDYQMSAMMMAVYFQGMDKEETLALTLEMAHSGEMMDLSAINGKKADKHSTGGVGDKTSLVLGPMVACCGVPVAKMSGRGLGHTGGTIDKLESFTGFSTNISPEHFIRQVNTIGMAIAGQTANLAPADKKLYALRDVTATVDQLSLIASSIMSKKLASGAETIVLDVKTGSGAFMKTEEDAFALARTMVEIGNGAGRNTIGVISDMDQPLGFAVGNTLEVKEAIAVLKGDGPPDVLELCLELGSYMLLGTGQENTKEAAWKRLEKTISDGSALEKFADFVEAQGGKREEVYHPELLKDAPIVEAYPAPFEGYVSGMNTQEVGKTVLCLGGGRETKESNIDLSVGLILHKKKGDYVKKGESLATIYASDPKKLATARECFSTVYTFSEKAIEKPVLIKGIINGNINENE